MEKRKRWHTFLIVAVLILTLYNIVPTIIFYAQPLQQPLDQQQAHSVASQSLARVAKLDKQSLAWVKAYTRLLQLNPVSIETDSQSAQLIHIQLASLDDAHKLREHFPRAGALIPFSPARMILLNPQSNLATRRVTVQRILDCRATDLKYNQLFTFTPKVDTSGVPTPFYRTLIEDRLLQVALTSGGVSQEASQLQRLMSQTPISSHEQEALLLALSQSMIEYVNLFGAHSSITKRQLQSFTQGHFKDKSASIQSVTQQLQAYLNRIRLNRIELENQKQSLEQEHRFLDGNLQDQLYSLQTTEDQISRGLALTEQYRYRLSLGEQPLDQTQFNTLLSQTSQKDHFPDLLGARNPFIRGFEIDYSRGRIVLLLHQDVIQMRHQFEQQGAVLKQQQLDRMLYDQLARIRRTTQEKIVSQGDLFALELQHLPDSHSLLVLNLEQLAHNKVKSITDLLRASWNPTHRDLSSTLFPIWNAEQFVTLSDQESRLGLLVYTSLSPHTIDSDHLFKSRSIYVVAKGIREIMSTFEADPSSPQAIEFLEDFKQLETILARNGFQSYRGTDLSLGREWTNDYIFELPAYYQPFIEATREDFRVHGTARYATLELSTFKHRLLTRNRIETEEHEDLLRWRDEYQAAQVKPNLSAKWEVPPPIQNPMWSNLKLSWNKYFRGDERKILLWGHDLSGGKTVQVELRDSAEGVVKDPASLQQGIEELYQRVNKMGVSEVTIRQEGGTITLDFPSAQGIMASDLVQASAMHFHIVHERFNPKNPHLGQQVDQFLQAIWNEAVLTERKDLRSLNQIARRHLYGEMTGEGLLQPASELSALLLKEGLELAHEQELKASPLFNDELCRIAKLRGDNFTDWNGQTHPLMIIMHNYALEGTSLTHVRPSYDPSKGNFLSFDVKTHQVEANGYTFNPQKNFYDWTAPFSQEKVQGTPLGDQSQGQGWRMAMLLNGEVISSPAIHSPLSDHVSVTGEFTTRQINRLSADLQAGSLSYTPHILSEQNISPELGLRDRYQGILATVVALIAVVVVMVAYYRFAGVLAAIAIFFNLLLMWAVLQNIQAILTLPGLAGIILTCGMAVDANVLVFESIREELAATRKLAASIYAGFRKAFPSILDSNVTTLIAAIILLQFDSGPIKGLALTLIVGIVSSMFTALFMTRYFFKLWLKRAQKTASHKSLHMMNLLKGHSFEFLKRSKLYFGSTLVVILFGACALVIAGGQFLGMDFKGGYAVSFELPISPGQDRTEDNYRALVSNALIQAGLSDQDFHVQGLSPNHFVKLFLSQDLDRPGEPFYNLEHHPTDSGDGIVEGRDPRITWIIEALTSDGVELTQATRQQFEDSWTNISGQVSRSMKINALWGLVLSLLAIFIYITIRFEWKYALSAILGLTFDLLVTLAVMALLHLAGLPIVLNLTTIAALMIILGYSLNDTIVVLVRIRENDHNQPKQPFHQLVNTALNTTLSRTLMTSTTTFVVILALLTLGSHALFGLSVVMGVGVLFGTFSSLFLVAPMLTFLHKERPSMR